MTQPNFHVNEAAIPASQFDNLPDAELLNLIAASHKLKTGRECNLRQTSPPPPKKVVDLSNILGGL